MRKSYPKFDVGLGYGAKDSKPNKGKVAHLCELIENSVFGKRVRVFGIGNNAIFYLPSIVSSVCKEAKIEQIEPIAITPELLKELGFENGRVGIWWHWWKDGFHLQHRDESEYWHFHGDIGFRYFHELESLYYMIYETELIPD
ncbi:hypothetical protein [Muribaculum intestinale]|uniref:hypothetical protein n=1 Tax=Muribaculum intestinale TaxID=1796646 RepID=UPI00272B0D0F|nr:hypothetical protein [Muribaculum intestinale]